MKQIIKSSSGMAGLYLVFHNVPLKETPGYRGVSHLVEHLLCKCYDHLQTKLQALCIDANAYTSSNEVVFHFTGLSKPLEEMQDELIKLFEDYEITEEDFHKEVKIVLQEYETYFNDQQFNHIYNLNRLLFNKYGALGERGDLQNLTFENFNKFYKEHFSKPDDIYYISAEDAAMYHPEPKGKAKELIGNYELKLATKHDNFIYEPGSEIANQSSLLFISPIFDIQGSTAKLICGILGEGLASPLYQEIREKRGLTYGVGLDVVIIDNQYTIRFDSMTTHDNVDKITELFQEVMGNLDKYFTQDRFNVMKGHYIIQRKINEVFNYKTIRRYIEPNSFQLLRHIDIFDYNETLRIAKEICNPDNFYYSVDVKEFAEHLALK